MKIRLHEKYTSEIFYRRKYPDLWYVLKLCWSQMYSFGTLLELCLSMHSCVYNMLACEYVQLYAQLYAHRKSAAPF